MIPPGLVTKQRVLAAFYVGALALMLSGAFAPLTRDLPWEPVLNGVGILALASAGMAAVFVGLERGSAAGALGGVFWRRSDEATKARGGSLLLAAAGAACIAAAAWLILY